MALPEVQTVEFQSGRPEDGTDPTGPFNAEYYVGLKPLKEWRKGFTKEKIEDAAREGLKRILPNADINVSQYLEDNMEEAMSGVKGENSVKIFGDDLQTLDTMAKQVKDGLEKTSGMEDVGIFQELGQPNLLIEVSRENAGALGITVQEVLDTVTAAIGGKEVTQVMEGEKSFSLLVRFPKDYRDDRERIMNIPIVLPGGGIVSLSRIANVRYDTGASFVYRENYRRYIPVKFSVASGDLSGTVKRAQGETAELKLPQGYYMEWSGIFNEMKESFKRFYVSIPISIFLILTVLYILYKSVRNVMITMVAPVFAVFAGLMALLVTGRSLSVSSIVGFISLVGVSVLNSSIRVIYYIERVRDGGDPRASILETGKARFRPVLMGGLVASLGLLPAALSYGVGSQIQQPLAIVLVGGMLIGMVIDLLISPLLLGFAEVKD
jgi:cobalt-zinc-cadmium resistance protein CzcA